METGLSLRSKDMDKELTELCGEWFLWGIDGFCLAAKTGFVLGGMATSSVLGEAFSFELSDDLIPAEAKLHK